MDINGLKGISPVFAADRVVRSETPADSSEAAVELHPALLGQSEEEGVTPSLQPVEEAVSSIQQFAQSIQRNLDFDLDDSSGRVVVKVTDGLSGEVIRQIPTEDALRLAESLEEVRSLLFEAKA
jgi:flagellar protein FlaG